MNDDDDDDEEIAIKIETTVLLYEPKHNPISTFNITLDLDAKKRMIAVHPTHIYAVVNINYVCKISHRLLFIHLLVMLLLLAFYEVPRLKRSVTDSGIMDCVLEQMEYSYIGTIQLWEFCFEFCNTNIAFACQFCTYLYLYDSIVRIVRFVCSYTSMMRRFEY